MAMRRSPRRPLILRRRKLPFQQNDPPAAESRSQAKASADFKEPSKSAVGQCFPDGMRIMDHPSMSDTQVVVIPTTADLHSVIGALTAKGKECGVQGPNKFILLSGNANQDNGSFCQLAAEEDDVSAVRQQVKEESSAHGSLDVKPLTGIKALNKELECGPLDDSLTNMQWLGKMNTFEQEVADKENQSSNLQAPNCQINVEAVQQPMSERPPYSYMAMIQFAINSRKSRRMTLREIYMWIENHFPYFREVAKPGWKQQKRMPPDARKMPTSSERRMKPLLPRTDSYLVPIQLPLTSSVFLPSSLAQFPPSGSQPKQNTSRGAKRVRIAPKVTQGDVPAVVVYPQKDKDLVVTVKEEPKCFLIKCDTPRVPPQRQGSSSRRKQRLVHSLHEEPVLLCPDNTFFDSGVVSDASTFQDARDTELDEHQREQHSPDRDFSFKTPIKGTSHLTSSTPSKPPAYVLPEPWKVTPVGKGSQSVLDFSPIRTPGGPAVTPRHDYTTFSFNGTPFKDWPLFSSPRELLTSAPARATGPSNLESLRSGCSRELLQAGGGGGGGAMTPANRSLTEGLVLDTMNDSLSKILVDISFSGLDDEELGMANISWSDFIPQFK
ncbi:forkhead box protein M1 isoform X4 [Clinocottus analis]|uniref:forkhead box protein M1 isoform X4 n=1 Tax=Clinocottus analis TaxID=304258 RepID=UPI0035BFC151